MALESTRSDGLVALHGLIVDLRAADPTWQASVTRFARYQKTQQIAYAHRYVPALGQQRECLHCERPIHVSASGYRTDLDGAFHDCGDWLLGGGCN